MFVDLQKGSHILFFIKNHSSWDEFAPGRIDFNRLVPERGDLNFCKYGRILMGLCGFDSW